MYNSLSYSSKGCVIKAHCPPPNTAPILLLDQLDSVDIAQLFAQLLDPMEHRGQGHTFCLRG